MTPHLIEEKIKTEHPDVKFFSKDYGPDDVFEFIISEPGVGSWHLGYDWEGGVWFYFASMMESKSTRIKEVGENYTIDQAIHDFINRVVL